MIQTFDDLVFPDKATPEQIEQIVKDKLGIGFPEMAAPLSKYVQDKAEELAQNYITVVCYGDYGKVIEGDAKIAEFFRTEAHKPEHWAPAGLFASKDSNQPEMIEVVFKNTAVDEADSMTGFVFVSFAGAIRHAFVTGDP
jgi:hypothetical protein